jgi:diacylglycerol kinase (ATP)
LRNQPKYNFFKNSSYALMGLKDIISSESSFKIELALLFVVLPIVLAIELPILEKLLLFGSYFFILIAEAINSAIERVVDLVTLDHHQMAKRAKDVGSTVVFLSIVQCVMMWSILLYKAFF